MPETFDVAVLDFLERDPHERVPHAGGYRTGCQAESLKSSEGTLHVRTPRLRETEGPSERNVLCRPRRPERRLRRLAVEVYARGLSARNLAETLTDAEGDPLRSRSAGSRLTDELYQEHEALWNLRARLPKQARKDVRMQAEQVHCAAGEDPGKLPAERFFEAFTAPYPQMVKCFSDDLEACLAHLNYRLAHRKSVRRTNLLERASIEEKRRANVMPQRGSEREALGGSIGAGAGLTQAAAGAGSASGAGSTLNHTAAGAAAGYGR